MSDKAPKPAVFIGSSSEGRRLAQAVQLLLQDDCEPAIWSQGTFGLTQGTLESLILALERFDFAVLVLTLDGFVVSRGVTKPTARDNVLFELGLFMGALGRERVFMLYDRTSPPDLPSDLAGIAAATLQLHKSGNLEESIGAACTQILRVIERHGIRDAERLRLLDTATVGVQGVSTRMESLLKLLARSRKVELDIVANQFGPMIDSEKLAQMRQDLEDLIDLLGDDGQRLEDRAKQASPQGP